MKHIESALLIFFFLALNVQWLKAQDCQIKGTITCKETNEKLDSVKIELYEGTMLYKIIKSDSVGRYDTGKFKLIDKDLSFFVSCRGYTAYKILFNKIRENSITFINFSLEKLTIEEVKQQQEERKKAIADPKKFKRKYYKVKRM